MGFSGVMRGTNQDAIDPNIAACQDSAESAPAGISTRPIAMAKPTKVSLPGSTANLKIAARAVARLMPRKRLLAFWSAVGEYKMTKIADHVMAEVPLGHAVAIQKSSTTLITMNTRVALTKAGSKSGRRNRATRSCGAP